MGAVKRAAIEAAQAAEPDPPGFGLAFAKDVSVRLSKATDTLAKKLTAAERTFAGLGFGLAADVPLAIPEEDGEYNFALLSYRRVGGAWGLYIVRGRKNHFLDVEDETETPILSASKAFRLRAAAAMGALVEAMIHTAEKQLAETEEANRVLDDALGDLAAEHARPSFTDDIPF